MKETEKANWNRKIENENPNFSCLHALLRMVYLFRIKHDIN